MKFTRTLTTFEAEAYDVSIDDNMQPKVEEIGRVEYASTRASSTEARKVFQDNGIVLKRGTKINIRPIKETVYACSLEDFLSIATPIGSVDKD